MAEEIDAHADDVMRLAKQLSQQRIIVIGDASVIDALRQHFIINTRNIGHTEAVDRMWGDLGRVLDIPALFTSVRPDCRVSQLRRSVRAQEQARRKTMPRGMRR